MKVKIGLAPGAWQWRGGGGAFFDFVDACEAGGWDSIWLSDRLVSDRMSLEPVTALAAAAARTRQLKFGTSVLALALRNPAVLAKELATVDFLSGGRMLPAVGLGGDDEREYEAAGTRKQERGARTDEAIEVLRRLWTEKDITHHGRFYHLSNVTITPRPVFQPHPPLWIGGRTRYAWDRVARLGDGWLVSSATAPEVAEGITYIKSALEQNGRTIDPDHYGLLLPAYVAPSREEAAERAVLANPRTRPDRPVDQYALLGTPEQMIDALRAYVAAGATKFVLRISCREDEMQEQLRLLQEHLVTPVNSAGYAIPV